MGPPTQTVTVANTAADPVPVLNRERRP
jgi:hypothetical protein